MTEINATYANLVSDYLDKGSALSSGNRYLALFTDDAATTESTLYSGRIDVAGVFGSASDGDRSNTSTVGPFTWVLPETIRGWAIMDASTAGAYVLRGALDVPWAASVLDPLTFGVGEIVTLVNPG